MREKVVDTVLIVTLIIVAFGITWTLLSLNRDGGRREAPREPLPGAEDSLPAGEGGLTITPLPLSGDEDEAAAPEGEEAEQATPAAAQAEPQAEVPDLEPVPPGAVALERVGFSFVTGGAGACGIVLEPWRHIAVSRELLAAYGCGAEVTVELAEETGGRTEFLAVVADTMNPVHSRTVNIYVGEDEPALEYGVTSGTLVP